MWPVLVMCGFVVASLAVLEGRAKATQGEDSDATGTDSSTSGSWSSS